MPKPQHTESIELLRERALISADVAAEECELGAEHTEGRVWTATGTLQRLAAAVVASVSGWVVGLKRIKLALQNPYLFTLFCVALFMRRYLPIKIRCLALKCRVLRLDESKVLAQDRRRSMLIDQFFKSIEEPHS